jgi:hypothetical protein
VPSGFVLLADCKVFDRDYFGISRPSRLVVLRQRAKHGDSVGAVCPDDESVISHMRHMT